MAPYLGSCLCGRVSYQMLSSPKAVLIATASNVKRVMALRLPPMELCPVKTYVSLLGMRQYSPLHPQRLCSDSFASIAVHLFFGPGKLAIGTIGYAWPWGLWTRLLQHSSKSTFIGSRSPPGRLSHNHAHKGERLIKGRSETMFTGERQPLHQSSTWTGFRRHSLRQALPQNLPASLRQY